MSDVFPRMVEKLPPGRLGRARIDHFDVSPVQAALQNVKDQIFPPAFDGDLEPGRFARLWVGEEMMMADTRPERISCLDVVQQARGHVLIAGLGLGMILWPIRAKPEVRTVTVVERYLDVIRLVSPHIPKGVRVLHRDAFDYRPTRRFDVIYLDIWPYIKISNLIDMTRLEARYAKHLARGGWMKSWQRETCERIAKREGFRCADGQVRHTFQRAAQDREPTGSA